MDLTGTILYFGSPSADKQIAADLDLDGHRVELTLHAGSQALIAFVDAAVTVTTAGL
jgi:hypothetical protein